MQELEDILILTICDSFLKQNPPWDHPVLTCDQAIEAPHVVMKNATEGEIWAFKLGIQYGLGIFFEHMGEAFSMQDQFEDLQKKYMHVKTHDK